MTQQNTILLLGDINSPHVHKWLLELSIQFRVAVFSIDRLKEENKSKVVSKNVIVYDSLHDTSNSFSVFRYLTHLFRLRHVIKKECPFVIHAHYATSYGMLGALTKNTTFCISVWGTDIRESPEQSWLHKIVLKWILKKTDQIFATSIFLEKLTKQYTKNNIQIIPFGVNITHFRPIVSTEKHPFTIGTVKTLDDKYGIDRLIDAFALFNTKYPNTRCMIYGKGTQKEFLQRKISSLSMNNAIFLKGYIDNEHVVEALSTFDVYCAFSRHESFGVAVLEASACEVPVITSNIDGLPEVVQHEHTGYLVDGNDTQQIVQYMEKLYIDANLRKQMGKNGRKFVQETYEWKKMAQKQIDFYHSLLK